MKVQAHVSEAKEKELKYIEGLMETYPVIGLVDLTNLPALQLQKIKYQLRDKIILRTVKKRLIFLALDKVKGKKKGLEKLKEELKGIPCLIFSKEDPFILGKLISKNKSSVPAKAGQIAPRDLAVPAGPTKFMAGPMIGEFGQMGIKTKVEDGKITILNEKLLVKEGEVINEKSADLLAKLGVEPMEIGLNLLLTYKDGEILPQEVLFVNEQEYIDNITKASREAVSLALEINYIVKDTAELLIAKAFREAEALKKETKFDETAVKAEEKKEEPVEKPKVIEEKKEEVKVEEKKEEPKIIKETLLEKEIREQKEAKDEEAPKDPEDKVVIEAKPIDRTEEMANKAKEILDNLVTEKLKKQDPIKPVKLREKKEINNVNEFINKLKDKKIKGEL